MGVSLKIVFFSLLFCVLAGIVSTGREEPVSLCRRGPLRCEIPAADCVTCNCTNPFINTQCDWYCKAQEAINKNTALNRSLADLQEQSRKISDKLEQSRIISDEILVQVMKNIKERIFNESIADLKDKLNRKAQETQRTESIFKESIADLKDQLNRPDGVTIASLVIVSVILFGKIFYYLVSHRAEICCAGIGCAGIFKCSGKGCCELVPGMDKKRYYSPRVFTPQSYYKIQSKETATLECYIRCNIGYSQNWLRIIDGKEISINIDQSKYKLDERSKTSLIITEIHSDDEGYYFCEATNSTGTGASCLILLIVDSRSQVFPTDEKQTAGSSGVKKSESNEKSSEDLNESEQTAGSSGVNKSKSNEKSSEDLNESGKWMKCLASRTGDEIEMENANIVELSPLEEEKKGLMENCK